MEYRDKLETPRLITRFMTPADVEVWMEYCSDPVATRYSAVPGMSPRQMAEFVLEKTTTRYAAGKGGLQALISKDTGELIGQCGLLIQEFGDRQEMEVGYHLLRRHWGKGYATEAAQMFRDHGFQHYPVNSIVSFIHPENIPSQNVALRNGMRLDEKFVECFGGRHHIFRITREEWIMRNSPRPV